MGQILENGYEIQTTFWEDFSVADAFGTDAINDDLSYDIKIIAMDKHIDETFNELMGNPTWHYYVRGGVMHLIERSDIIEIEISDIIQKRIYNKKP